MSAIIQASTLSFPFSCVDPFLFAVYHNDAYPAGDEHFCPPKALLKGRQLGSDFGSPSGWSMYHGKTVPGFPAHPHRGFETVTLVRHGVVDHFDSTGASGRFGEGGDAQWMTAGKGISHSEMFPLLDRHGPNNLELFQIWLNLPRAKKMVPPHFKMLWHEDIPTIIEPSAPPGAPGASTRVAVVAGRGFLPAELEARMPTPPPDSYAFHVEQSDVAIVTLSLQPGAAYTIPPARAGGACNRKLFFFKGAELTVAGQLFKAHTSFALRAELPTTLLAGASGPVELLLLQGVPIGEPVVQHGPFVMNSREEIAQAFADYQKGGFGEWPHGDNAPVHPREALRFAKYSDGKLEERPWPAKQC
jgi:hypothetical protein